MTCYISYESAKFVELKNMHFSEIGRSWSKLVDHGRITKYHNKSKPIQKNESGGKWTVQKGESGRSRKWTVRRKWTVHLKVDGPGLKWTVFWRKVDGPAESGRSFDEKWTVPG